MVTVDHDSIINMAVALIRSKTDFSLVHNTILGGVVVSASFEADESALRAAKKIVAEQRLKRGQL